MNRIQTACFALMASAFLLAGLLVTQINTRFTSVAQAEMTLRGGGITLMTATTRQGEESLFLLDDATQRLLVYTADPNRKRIEREAVLDLGRAFQLNVRPGAAAGTGPTTSPR